MNHSRAADAARATPPRIVVIGGGNAGLSVAGRLRRAGLGDVTVVEPRTQHVFAPLQSHIAGGARVRGGTAAGRRHPARGAVGA